MAKNKSKKKWIPFYFNSNSFSEVIDTRDKWKACVAAFKDFGVNYTKMLRAKRNTDTIKPIPDFGLRLEYERGDGETLKNWARKNQINLDV